MPDRIRPVPTLPGEAAEPGLAEPLREEVNALLSAGVTEALERLAKAAAIDVANARTMKQARQLRAEIRYQVSLLLETLEPIKRTRQSCREDREQLFLQRAKRLADRWNTFPWPSLAQIAEEEGVTRQAVDSIFSRAREKGLHVLTTSERRSLERQYREDQRRREREKTLSLRPKCCICDKPVQKTAKQHTDGRYYCTKHRLCDPVAKERQSRQSYEAQRRRLETDPAYRDKQRRYHREYWRRKHQSAK